MLPLVSFWNRKAAISWESTAIIHQNEDVAARQQERERLSKAGAKLPEDNRVCEHKTVPESGPPNERADESG